MPQLELREWLSLISSFLTLVGVYVALRLAVAKLEVGQTEIVRQLTALHKRLDDYGKELTRLDKDHVRLEERVRALRESQRFTLRNRVSESGEVPMFADGEV